MLCVYHSWREMMKTNNGWLRSSKPGVAEQASQVDRLPEKTRDGFDNVY